MRRQTKKRSKRNFVVAIFLALVMALTAIPAYATVIVPCQGIRWWNVGPTYGSWNEGKHNQWGAAGADIWSTMKIWCEERGVQSGAIHSWAGITRGTSFGEQFMEWGPENYNGGALARGENVIAEHYKWIGWAESAAAWGYGTVRSADLSIHEVNSENIWLFGGFCGRDSGIGPAQRAKTTIWN